MQISSGICVLNILQKAMFTPNCPSLLNNSLTKFKAVLKFNPSKADLEGFIRDEAFQAVNGI